MAYELDTYLTLSKTSEGLYKEKGSKFIAFAMPIKSVEDTKNILDEKRKEFHDARHVCFAYILEFDGSHTRCNDDGEPSGTAGKPILNILQSNNLTNTIIVVVRYFGGTKLGTSGLINAYSEASKDAILNNTIIEKKIQKEISILFEYPFMNEIMKIIKDFETTIIEQTFDMQCSIKISIRLRDYQTFLSRIEKAKFNSKCGIIKIID